MDNTLDLVNALSSASTTEPRSPMEGGQPVNPCFLGHTSPRENTGYVDPDSWNKPPSRQGKGLGKGKAPPTPPGRLPPAMTIPKAMTPSRHVEASTDTTHVSATPNESFLPTQQKQTSSYSTDQASPLNPFVDNYMDDDIVFISESPADIAAKAHQNESLGDAGLPPAGPGGSGGWWRNLRNRHMERQELNHRSGTAQDIRRVSLRPSMSTVALDSTGEFLLASGLNGDGSELGMVREDQPHLVVSLLQARNMIPTTWSGRLIQKFTCYFIINYGGFERKTMPVMCPSGAALLDQHLVFPAISERTDLVFSLMSKGNLVDKCIASITIEVEAILGRRVKRNAQSTLESSGGFGVVLDSVKLNSPLCHAEWFSMDSTTPQAVLAEINISLTPTLFRQLPSILEACRGNREEKCRIVRELEDLATTCVATELLPTQPSMECDMTSSSAALAEEMRSLRQSVWKDVPVALSNDLFDVNIGGDISDETANSAPLSDSTDNQLKQYLSVLLGRVRKHVQTFKSDNQNTRRSSIINQQLKDKVEQIKSLNKQLSNQHEMMVSFIRALSTEAGYLKQVADDAMKQDKELWSLTVEVGSTKVVVRLPPEYKVLHILALLNSELPEDSIVVELSKQAQALKLDCTLRSCLSPGTTLVAQLLKDGSAEMISHVPEEQLESLQEVAVEDELEKYKAEVLRMRRENGAWVKAQKHWAEKEQGLRRTLEVVEREKNECSGALAQARTVTAKMESLCAELTQRAKTAEARATRIGAALDTVLSQLSVERSSANATVATLEAERQEMLQLMESARDQRIDLRNDQRQRELQRRVAVEDSRQHQISDSMGMAPLSPEKPSSNSSFKISESEPDTLEEPETLKEYYEQKRLLRERHMRLGGKLEVGADGLLVAREKKKGPLRLNQGSPSKIDWSGY